MKLVIALVLLASNIVHAELPDAPYVVGVSAGARFMTGTSYPELAISGARRWWGRLHLGARATAGLSATSTVVKGLAEVGVVLHPSRSIELLLAWRAGVAYHRVEFPSGVMIPIRAAVVEPIVELSFRIGAATELHVAPFTIAAHHANMWLFVMGGEITVARRF